MGLFQASLDTCLDSLLLCQPLSSQYGLHGLRALNPIKGYFSRIVYKNLRTEDTIDT